MHDGATFADSQVIDDVQFTGLQIQLDLTEGYCQARCGTAFRQIVFGDTNQPGAGKPGNRPLGNFVNVSGKSAPLKGPPSIDRFAAISA